MTTDATKLSKFCRETKIFSLPFQCWACLIITVSFWCRFFSSSAWNVTESNQKKARSVTAANLMTVLDRKKWAKCLWQHFTFKIQLSFRWRSTSGVFQASSKTHKDLSTEFKTMSTRCWWWWRRRWSNQFINFYHVECFKQTSSNEFLMQWSPAQKSK